MTYAVCYLHIKQIAISQERNNFLPQGSSQEKTTVCDVQRLAHEAHPPKLDVFPPPRPAATSSPGKMKEKSLEMPKEKT